MKALVTGGSGFLGKYIVCELLHAGIETISYDVSPPQDNSLASNSLFRYIKGDVLDPESLLRAMDTCDLVFHTAAIADINEARKKPATTMEVNVIGTVRCLEAARNYNIKRFILASSVYTSGNRGSFYSVSKKACEELCKTFYEEKGPQYTIVKYGSLYGRDANHWNFIYGVCKSLLTTRALTYSSSPDAVREYIHILDAARETVRISLDESYINRSVLITGHQRMKMVEFFDMVEEILGYKVDISYTESENIHYIKTPYSFTSDIPVRINLQNYIDISEGILDCLRIVQEELNATM